MQYVVRNHTGGKLFSHNVKYYYQLLPYRFTDDSPTFSALVIKRF